MRNSLTKSMTRVFLFSLSILFFSAVFSDVTGKTKNATTMVTASSLAAAPLTFSRPVYFSEGKPVIDPKAVAAGTATILVDGQPVQTASCACNDERAYQPPSSLTLVFDNTAGVTATTFKLPSFDNVVEAIRGSIGTAFPSVQEMPNGNGTILDQQGNGIFGAMAFVAQMASMPIAIKQTIITGSGVEGANKKQTFIVNRYRGNLNRVIDSQIIHRAQVIANSSIIQMISEEKLWYFTPNTALSLIVPTGSVINMEMVIVGIKPIDEAI